MDRSDTLLEVRSLSKVYFDKKGRPLRRALHDATFDLYRGEIFGLLGVNGAGKTTLSSILATMHPPTSGAILWRELSIYQQLLEYRKIVGMCPQKPNIEKRLNVEENLLFAGRCYGLTRKEAMERKEALMAHFALEDYAHATTDQLSGGYRQRLLIARALMHRPELLILDEPTVGLDPHIRRQIWEVIKTLKSTSVSVILTTHYLDEAEYLSDRVCLIHDGLIKAIDSPNNFKKMHQKNTLEEVFLKFVDDPEAEIFIPNVVQKSDLG
jgi:ABC-2 type transport system ATP-binding protein